RPGRRARRAGRGRSGRGASRACAGYIAAPAPGRWPLADRRCRPRPAIIDSGAASPWLAGARCTTPRTRMSIVWTILIGFVAGLVARAIKPGDDSAGFIVTTLIGIAGSLIATYVGQAMGWYTAGQGAGFIASVVGAIVLLFLYGL